MNKKVKAILLSIFFWGSGQFFICKQRGKGIVLFFIQMLAIGTELFSGYWIEYARGLIPDFSIRLHGGLFTKGIWGLITLGEKTGGIYGDHSTMLLIKGVIALFILLALAGVYIWNIRDARKSSLRAEQTGIYENTKGSFRASIKRSYSKNFPYFILTPVGAAFLLVVVLPIIFTFLTAFLNYNREHLPPGQLLDWVGLANFKKLFTVSIWSKTFFQVLGWTLAWTFVSTFSTYFLGLFQAVILNHKAVICRKMFRAILILPWAIPQMVSLLVFRNLLNGQFSPINQFLIKTGLISKNISFLSDPVTAKVTVILVSLWLGFPMFMVMMLGVLSNMDQSLYEAAAIDGADKTQIFRQITLPLVLKATTPNLIMSMAANFNGFGLIYFLTQGGPANTNMQFAGDTDILISWIYKLTLNQQMYDIAAVMSVLLFVLAGFVSLWNFRRTVAFKEL